MTFGSLFAGIEGFGLGFERAGFKCVWQVERDQQCLRVLAHHWPDVLRLDEVAKAGKKTLPRVDVITFGSPCQDLSVAGKRKGLKGERSGLFHEAIRVLRELRPAFGVWENVPGSFSSDAGHDFLAVLRAFHECGAHDVAWRVLDSRYFDVAQRRERVFVVADFRGERAGKILFESPCGCGNFATGSEAGTRVAPCLETGANRTGGHRPPGTTVDTAETLQVCYGIRSHNGEAKKDHAKETEIANAGGVYSPGQGGTLVASIPARSCADRPRTGRNGSPERGDETLIAFDTTQITSAANYSNPKSGDPCHPLAATAHPPAIFQTRIGRNGRGQPKSIADNLTSSEGGTHADSKPHVFGGGHGVRRLMPIECLRLQGFPDSWLNLEPLLSDSAKYRMIGNAVTVSVAEWIGRRIMEASA